jgi:hypothetical protein
MTKYARIKEGHLIDVWRVPEDYPDIETRDRCLGAEGWIEVPDDKVHGATANADGTFTNPPAHSDTPVPVVFDSADWKAYAYGVLGAIAAPNGTQMQKLQAGMRRYGAILKAARASTDEGTIAALDQYDDATNYRQDKVQVFLGFLNADAKIVTDTEFAAIIGNWPSKA